MHVPVLTDVHETADVAKVAEVADILQIPAFLCRQTDLVVAAAMTERVVNIKKGQFVSPNDMRHIVEKCRTAGNDKVFVTERGSSFGYNNLVVDMRSLPIMRKFVPVVFDATHSVQLPSSAADGDHAVSGGQPEFIPVLARAAVAAGVDGIFMEVHDNPKEAKSDGANALESTKLREVLKELQAIQNALTRRARQAVNRHGYLNLLPWRPYERGRNEISFPGNPHRWFVHNLHNFQCANVCYRRPASGRVSRAWCTVTSKAFSSALCTGLTSRLSEFR